MHVPENQPYSCILFCTCNINKNYGILVKTVGVNKLWKVSQQVSNRTSIQTEGGVDFKFVPFAVYY